MTVRDCTVCTFPTTIFLSIGPSTYEDHGQKLLQCNTMYLFHQNLKEDSFGTEGKFVHLQ